MKKIFIMLLAAVTTWSCNNDFLELRPETQLGESESFWTSESSLKTYSDGFYDYVDRSLVTADFSSDNCEHMGNPPEIRRGVYAVPTALASGGWNWTQLRNINYFINNIEKAELAAATRNEYLGLARFFRAWFYYNKVRQFGDVPWYSQVLNTNDEELIFKARDPRTMVMDSVLNDLDFAVSHLPVARYKNRISKWTALALKSRIGLYEGTYRKYQTAQKLTDSERFLTEAASAAEELIASNSYKLYSTGNPDKDYFQLFQPKDTYTDEVILARSSDTQTFYYTPLFTSTSNGNNGATRSLVSSYLMKNGQTFQQRYPSQQQRDTMSYFSEFTDRDPRLAQSLVYPGYIRVGTTSKSVSDFAQNTTGYMIHKAVGPPSEDQGGGYRDVILIRYAEVLLNYAEAKAELGTLSQADIDKSLNVIRARVGIPGLKLPVAADAYQASLYEHQSDPLILEVRRERRSELAFEGFRTEDLKRWNEGQRFRATYEGIYISALHRYIDLDQDGKPDLYVLRNNETPPANQISGVQYYRLNNVAALSEGNKGRLVPYSRALPVFNNWEYLSPIPSEELTINTELKQNPGWQ
ncbi:RagB/SusD family nutrient uptake outer membrane protein [Dyadobacter aurulentus]|uniref:RagB/SusD family nutrient uptake outer membrane protein n=1 Tax=Dyadobacter sp. UC 10 TaxID=2605428 RepID=UPI0011F3361C|nr:RagB/SusD family nutrient uptake outer membrane protein [Dyadobacter sp. UC 10]KAA0992672.1 RagB/SusD family nutrient uptake outer membrane protein [Dyadobacter sp. UC 10]